VFSPASRGEGESVQVPVLFPAAQVIRGSGSVQVVCWLVEAEIILLHGMRCTFFSRMYLMLNLAQCIHLSSVDFYAASRPAGLNHMDTFALEPGGEVLLQDQYRLAWFVGCQVTFLDGPVNGVVAALGQLGRFIYGQGILADHPRHTSSTAALISAGDPQTQVTLLIPVTSSRRSATGGGQRRRPRMMWLRKSGPIWAAWAI